MFDGVYEIRDGFDLYKDKFEFPPNFAILSTDGKRAVVVCDLFINGGFTVEKIMQFLEENYGNVVRTLIAQGVIKDRRFVFGKSPSGQERRARVPTWLVSQAEQ